MLLPPPLQDWMILPQGFSPAPPAHLGLRLKQLLGFKRWIYLLFNGEDHQLGLAWVDLGYVSKVFAHLSPGPELLTKGLQAVSVETLCIGQRHPWRKTPEGWLLQAVGPGLYLDFRLDKGSDGGVGLLNLNTQSLSLTAQWQSAAQALLWADNALPHHTHKAFAQAASWQVHLPDQKLKTKGLMGADVSFGMPPRHTRWFWAFAQSQELGFNLVQGFVGADECGLWHQGRLSPLAEGRFCLPKDPNGPWQIETEDQQLQLIFEPESAFRDNTQLGLVSSDFIQAYGRFHGRLILPDGEPLAVELPGVAEFQDTRW